MKGKGKKDERKQRKLNDLKVTKTIRECDEKKLAGGYDAEGNGVQDAINFLKR